RAGGWDAMAARLPAVMTHSWQYMGHAQQNPMGVEVFGLTAGLGFVLSFGYWCTDFLVVQRAMAAESMSAARRTPVLAAFPKMMMPFIVIVPGVVALSLSKMAVGYDIPMKFGYPDYDQVLTTLMAKFYPAGMLGVGITALLATFLLGMFWKRATGHGAFLGLLAGTGAAAATHGLTVAEHKGGWIANLYEFPSTMAQNFWIAIFAWLACFLVTLAVSMLTKP